MKNVILIKFKESCKFESEKKLNGSYQLEKLVFVILVLAYKDAVCVHSIQVHKLN